MKHYLFLICAALLLSACAAEKEDLPLNIRNETIMWEETALPEETVTPETVSLPVEPELLTQLVDPEDTDFVLVKDYIPGILTELKYGTTDNFTGQAIYEFEDVFLRYGTVMKLCAVSEELAQRGLYLKIWDGFRPVSAQFKLWEICPDPTYVADPNKGFSNHSRGYAVDLTLVDADGNELPMPTGFDNFSSRADRDYSECDDSAAENARLLESVMEKYGFQGYWGEWWHYNDTKKYDVEMHFDPAVISRRYVEKASELLKHYWDDASVILTVPEGESVTLLGFCEGYSIVEYLGYRGYLPSEHLR